MCVKELIRQFAQSSFTSTPGFVSPCICLHIHYNYVLEGKTPQISVSSYTTSVFTQMSVYNGYCYNMSSDITVSQVYQFIVTMLTLLQLCLHCFQQIYSIVLYVNKCSHYYVCPLIIFIYIHNTYIYTCSYSYTHNILTRSYICGSIDTWLWKYWASLVCTVTLYASPSSPTKYLRFTAFANCLVHSQCCADTSPPVEKVQHSCTWLPWMSQECRHGAE